MKRIALTLATLGSFAVPATLSASAHADDGYENVRDGLTFGVGIGGGNLGCSDDGCEDFEGSGSFDLHIGGMTSESLAVLFDAWWMVHSEDDLTVSQGIMTGGVRVWPVQHFWLQGGVGVARAAYEYDGTFFDLEDRSEWVPAFQVGIGVEPIATDNFGLDIALRYGTGFYSDGDNRIHSGALTIGASFY